MKISKLFHWLYAILMFLPILVFIPNAFYYGFNKEAVAQEKIEEVPVYYETNIVTQNEDILINKIYHWSDNYNTTLENQYKLLMNFSWNSINNDTGQIYINASGNLYISISGHYYNAKTTQFDFIASNINYENIPSDFYQHVIPSTLKVVNYYTTTTTNMSITDSMSYAWKSVWQNDLFSWTNDTFLKEPFVYITDLFSIPSNNVLINALSYWLDISIIWLVFDVIMYVPLLTHRWLDKGIVE